MLAPPMGPLIYPQLQLLYQTTQSLFKPHVLKIHDQNLTFAQTNIYINHLTYPCAHVLLLFCI